ncbi:MAG: hypothetical protein HYZ26_00940, partial [Chloroflexi bacterium]|nr:hypothetical protein [Chloroflexota bacterium]
WFMGIIVVFWILTVAPAYATLLAPGVANSINTAINFISGFVVPVSAALLSLASVGIITGLDPNTRQILDTLRIFNQDGGVGVMGLFVAGGAAATGTVLTSAKAAAKPAFSASTGTIGTASAPIYATLENVMSVVVIGLIAFLSSLSPWLLVLLLIAALALAGVALVYSVRQLRKLKSGLGQLARLFQTNPKGGWSVTLEFFIWGLGWLIQGRVGRGLGMLAVWAGFGFAWWGAFGVATLFTPLLACFLPLSLLLYVVIALGSARALMRSLPPVEIALAAAPA